MSGGWTEVQILTKAGNSESWGASLALSHLHVLFVGSPYYSSGTAVTTGRVEVYAVPGALPTDTWALKAELVPPNGETNTQGRCSFRFDFAAPGTMAVQGDTVAIGAPAYCLSDAASTAKQQGAVFVYTPTTPHDYTAWTMAALLSARDYQDFAAFGSSVAIVASAAPIKSAASEPADLIVVGSPKVDANGGSAGL